MLTKNDLSQIKTVVRETIQPEIQAVKKSMATKDDLKDMASKTDLKNLETRLTDNMKSLEVGLKGDMKSLKVDMKSLKVDMKGLKSDMENLETRLIGRIDEAQMEIIATVDKHKADKGKVDNLEKRVERLEDNSGLPPYADQ